MGKFDEHFDTEFEAFPLEVRETIVAGSRLLEMFGPQLGRPYADTLKGSKYLNLKEMRLSANKGEWRVTYAFDPRRKAILLVAGDKSGVSENRFYRGLISKAEFRLDRHLANLVNKGSD